MWQGGRGIRQPLGNKGDAVRPACFDIPVPAILNGTNRKPNLVTHGEYEHNSEQCIEPPVIGTRGHGENPEYHQKLVFEVTVTSFISLCLDFSPLCPSLPSPRPSRISAPAACWSSWMTK